MPLYQLTTGGTNLSALVTALQAQHEAMRAFERGTDEPAVKPTGLIHWTTGGGVLAAVQADYPLVTSALAYYDGANWNLVGDMATPFISSGGTVPFSDDQDMGGHKLTGLAAATANGDAVRYEQALRLVSGNWDALSHKIQNVTDPVSAQDAATKAYVDALGVSPHAATLFYNNEANPAGGSFNGIVQQTGADPTNTYTKLPEFPRMMWVRFGPGSLCTDGTNTVQTNGVLTNSYVFPVFRWDAITGDGGTPGAHSAFFFTISGTQWLCEIDWKDPADSPDVGTPGFFITWRRVSDNARMRLARTGSLGNDGPVHVMALTGAAAG